jgi:hypothetical protein
MPAAVADEKKLAKDRAPRKLSGMGRRDPIGAAPRAGLMCVTTL